MRAGNTTAGASLRSGRVFISYTPMVGTIYQCIECKAEIVRR
jgi:hypothetical protein